MKDGKYDEGFLKQSLNLKHIREERKKEVAKDALFREAKKRIITTAVGALDTLEKKFGFLWGFEDDSHDEELSDFQKQIKEIYEEAREVILENGHDQSRRLSEEFAKYEISRKRYNITLPVGNNKNLGDQKDGKK
tara:strand:+ start:5805 stop:6209 length:405 start_codon:yes stop_codon:yes gene_type:complete